MNTNRPSQPGRAATPNPAPVNPEALELTRHEVRSLLMQSSAFRAMPPDQQREIAKHTVDIATYLSAPDGIKGNTLSTGGSSPRSGQVRANDPYAVGLADITGPGLPSSTSTTSTGGGTNDPSKFVAQGAREGAAVAGALLREVNFPEFVSGLINGVFHSIVQSSIQQMEAYGQLVKSVAQTLNQFRDENVSVNQGRDHLVDSYPDVFRISMDTGDFGEEGSGPRVTLRDGVDEDSALKRVNEGMDRPVSSLDDETIEGELVPAARTQLATSRQQLLATMVLMGINRIIVTDGKIAAKVMYDFRAQDNFKYRMSATKFDYDPTAQKTTTDGQSETEYQGGERSANYTKDQGFQSTNRGASYYSKGQYKTTNEPVMTMMSIESSTTDAALQTRANLAGTVEVNFKSETFPLERMADSFQIGMIQNASQQRGQTGSRGVGAGTNTNTTGGSPQQSTGATTPAPTA